MRSVLSRWGIIAFTAFIFLSGCSKQDNFAPAPAAQNPNPLPGSGVGIGIGGNLEDPSPGTPLNGANYQQAMQQLLRNFSGVGKGNAQSQTVIDYLVQSGYGDAVFRPTPSTSQPNLPLMSYDIQSNGEQVILYSRVEGSISFRICYTYDLYGRRLLTTDQVALYVSGNLLMKVFYANQNPQIQLYDLEAFGGQYGQISLHVTAVQMATTFLNQGGGAYY